MTFRPGEVWLTLLVHLPAAAAVAQDPLASAAAGDVAHVHIGYVADAYYEAPGGAGLLQTAVGEAQVASQHAELAASEIYELAAMKRHVVQLLHAIDPELVAAGPGLGYGVRRAAQGIVDHIELAAEAEDASYNVGTHARYIAGAARSVIARADRIVVLAQRVQSQNLISAAASLTARLQAETQALFAGTDVDGDGRIGWAEPEGGLRQIQQHLTLLKRGEASIQGGVRP